MGMLSETYCTIDQAAELIGVSPTRVHQYLAAGRLSSERIGRMVLIPRAQVDGFVRRPPGRPER